MLLLNTTLFLKSFTKHSKAFRFFSIYLSLMCLIQLLSLLVAKVLHKPNLFLSHFYLIFQFVFLSLFYYQIIKNKIILFLMIPILTFLSYQYLNDFEIFFRYNSLGIAITQLLLVIYAVAYFFLSLKGKITFIIINTGLLLYLLSSTLIFVSGNLIFNVNISESLNFLLIGANRLLYFIFQILIFIEWRKNYYRKTLKS